MVIMPYPKDTLTWICRRKTHLSMEKKHGISQILNGTAIFYLHWNLPKLPSFVGLHRPAPLSILGYGCTKANGGVVAGVPLRFPNCKMDESTSHEEVSKMASKARCCKDSSKCDNLKKQKKIEQLVGGFNPFEKKFGQIGSFPQVGVQIKNLLKPPSRQWSTILF